MAASFEDSLLASAGRPKDRAMLPILEHAASVLKAMKGAADPGRERPFRPIRNRKR